MKTILKLAVFACVAVTALALAGSALATQKLEVSQTSSPASITVRISKAQTDPQPAKITIYIPAGYTLNTSQPIGAVIGKTTGQVFVNQLNVPVPLEGNVVVEDPAKHVTDVCAPGTHQAVWMLNLSVANQTTHVPIYIDPTTGGEAALGSAKGELCLSRGDTPEGTPLIFASFTVNNVLTPPATPARWIAFWTPYAAGGVVNRAGTVETRSVVGPGSVSLRAKVNKKTRRVTLSGVVRQAGVAVSGAAVRITANNRVVRNGTVRTKASGAYTLTLRKATRRVVTTFFQARVTAGARDITSTGCASPTLPPVPCVSATAGGFTAASAKVRVRL